MALDCDEEPWVGVADIVEVAEADEEADADGASWVCDDGTGPDWLAGVVAGLHAAANKPRLTTTAESLFR